MQTFCDQLNKFAVALAVSVTMVAPASAEHDAVLNHGGKAPPELDSVSQKATASEDSKPSFAGRAHWYGKELHGRPTASGEIFDKDKFTAAHPDLPLGTHVRVRSLHTGKEVIVKVNDRCPHMKQRCIDLSEGAAREIGIWPFAPAHVHCTILGKHPKELQIANSTHSKSGKANHVSAGYADLVADVNGQMQEHVCKRVEYAELASDVNGQVEEHTSPYPDLALDVNGQVEEHNALYADLALDVNGNGDNSSVTAKRQVADGPSADSM